MAVTRLRPIRPRPIRPRPIRLRTIRLRTIRLGPARWATALSLPLLALAVAAPAASAAPAHTVRYVALGDSYAAGPFIPSPTGQPVGCLRSDHDYAHIAAPHLEVTTLVDVTCSGATTDDLAAAQAVTGGSAPPQLQALDAATDLVTMTMGGNDIGFASIVTECAIRSPLKPLGAGCKDYFTSDGTDQLAARIAAAAPKIRAAVAAIKDRAPDATVALVGYPAILPDTGPGCFPLVPFSPGDVAYLRGVEKQLNAMIAAAAAKAGATFVDTYTPSIGHDVCTLPGTKWIEGLIPTAPAAPVHPNVLGEAGMAAAVVAALAPDATRT